MCLCLFFNAYLNSLAFDQLRMCLDTQSKHVLSFKIEKGQEILSLKSSNKFNEGTILKETLIDKKLKRHLSDGFVIRYF